jgi:hypothetical protein
MLITSNISDDLGYHAIIYYIAEYLQAMNLKNITIILVVPLLLGACSNKDNKEEHLQTRERELEHREQRVMAIEADYKELVNLRDSLRTAERLASDSISINKTWPDYLQRVWSSKMVCEASDCSNYVIGDQRNEVWKFLSDSTGLYMNVFNKEKLVRVFKGNVSANKLILDYTTDRTSSNQHIQIVLEDSQKAVIRGTQTITDQKNCTAKFSVELTLSTNK